VLNNLNRKWSHQVDQSPYRSNTGVVERLRDEALSSKNRPQTTGAFKQYNPNFQIRNYLRVQGPGNHPSTHNNRPTTQNTKSRASNAFYHYAS
jgi:hypothetical protein|tara:strand:- start:974 stop:1252 length:279 start_codon:yes stop_codon:yes gene_type:complete